MKESMSLVWWTLFGTVFAGVFLLPGFSYSEQGGTAGCPLAATLSQYYNVLLIKRGGSPFGNKNVTNITSAGAPLSDLSPTLISQRFISEDGVINARACVLGGGTYLNAAFYSRAGTYYMRNEGWDEALVNQSYKWVEKSVSFKPTLSQWQSAIRDGLLESGVLPYNGFTYDHMVGIKIGGTTFDRNGHRHTASHLLKDANLEKLTVLLSVRQIKTRKKIRAGPDS